MLASATDVFVSYKAEDRARLKPLVAALEAEGFSVWWDTHIGGGSHWREDIQEHLDTAKCVIVVWTKRSVGPEGDFVRDEATRARKRGAYLPVRLDLVDAPLGFGEVQAISLKGWHGDRSDPRFLTLAEAVRRRIAGEDIAHVMVPRDGPAVSRRALLVGGAGIGALAVAGVGGWLLLKPAPANAKRIAVMSFDNLSGDPNQAYFAEGIAEELRSSLSRVGMQVIGRASCDAAKNLDTKTAAAKLDVANILTGSFRRSTDTIRIAAQLVSGTDGVEHWQQSYDRAPGDAIKIETDIAENVASALSIVLGEAGRAALALGGTEDSVAQDLVLQSKKLGRDSTDPQTFRRRLALINSAIARDPRYADAYVEKSNVLFLLGENYGSTPAEVADKLAQADASGRKAVSLAPELGSAHVALANIAHGRLDFPSMLKETKESLSLAPDDSHVLAYAGENLAVLESPEEGAQVVERGIALDPLNPGLYAVKCEVLTYLRRYHAAIEAGRKALELAPERRSPHIFIGDALLLLGQPAQAKVEYEALGAGNPFQLERLALLAARTRDRPGAEQMITQLKQQLGATASYQYGEIYAQLGDSNRAFTEFENAVVAKDAGLAFLRVDPFLDRIRNDPRHAALLRKLRLE